MDMAGVSSSSGPGVAVSRSLPPHIQAATGTGELVYGGPSKLMSAPASQYLRLPPLTLSDSGHPPGKNGVTSLPFDPSVTRPTTSAHPHPPTSSAPALGSQAPPPAKPQLKPLRGLG